MPGGGFGAGFFGVHRTAYSLHAFADSTELRKQRVRRAAIVLQVLLTRVGDVVELAGAVDLDSGMPDFFEIRERGVDHAGTRYVKTLGAFVQGLDDFVAMAGLFREQPQYQELKVDGAQFSPHTEGPAAHVPAHEPPAKRTEPAAPM